MVFITHHVALTIDLAVMLSTVAIALLSAKHNFAQETGPGTIWGVEFVLWGFMLTGITGAVAIGLGIADLAGPPHMRLAVWVIDVMLLTAMILARMVLVRAGIWAQSGTMAKIATYTVAGVKFLTIVVAVGLGLILLF